MSTIPSLLELGVCPPGPPPSQMNCYEMAPDDTHKYRSYNQSGWSHESPYSRPTPYMSSLNLHATGHLTQDRSETGAKHMIDSWLTKHGLSTKHRSIQDDETHPSAYTLLELKWMVSKLNVVHLKLADTQLSEETQQSLQKEANKLMQTLADPHTKDLTRRRIERANKRKARRQKSVAKKNHQLAEQEKVIEKKHEVLDKWLLSLEEKKQTEEMMKAADRSMSGVRQKITDVKRQQELIESLVKLRKIRAEARGMKGGNSNFEKKIGDLMFTLTQRLGMYKKEEMALQVMLEHERDEKQAEKERIEKLRMQKYHLKKEKRLQQWLFGGQEVAENIKSFFQYYSQAEETLDTFLKIRHGWDSFIVPNGAPVSGSQIPRGWVVPSVPSSPGWAEFLSSS